MDAAPRDVRRDAKCGNSRVGGSESGPCRLPRAETAVSESRNRSSVTHSGEIRQMPTESRYSCLFSHPKIYAPKPTRADGLCDNGQEGSIREGA